MLHQVIEIQEENRYLSLERGFLKIRKDDVALGTVPLDDIAVLLISAQGLSLSKNILVELSERGAITIFCGKNYSPQSIVYPLTGNYKHSGVLKKQIEATIPFKKQVWKKIVETKIENQAKTISLCGHAGASQKLLRIAKDVKSGDSSNREAVAAKLYWSILFGKDFVRDKDGEGLNALLNYGYAVMRSAMCRALCSAGLHPSIGIHHNNSMNPFCLADDFFEIYRPLVDYMVFLLSRKWTGEFSSEIKQILIKTLWVQMNTSEGFSPAFQSMQYMAYSFVNALQKKAKQSTSLSGRENMKNFPVLNKYELMWMMVLFDLPVVEKKERKEASDFRNFLLDCGFSMVQYSIYIKVLSGTDACDKYYRVIEKSLPEKGKVDILTITDRQYENIRSFTGKAKTCKKNTQKQLLLF